MVESFQDMKLVSGELLQERLESVKDLQEEAHEAYDIMKDTLTGEHYLHYAYRHVDVAQGGVEEMYHYLLPIESDDVLAMMFGEQPYHYPDHWQRRFLRNGPEGDYVWFDPREAAGTAEDETIGQAMREKLLQLKQQQDVNEDAVRQMLNEVDDLFKGKA